MLCVSTDGVKLVHSLELPMYLVFPDSMLHIASLFDITPGTVELVQLDCHFTQVLQIKCLHTHTHYNKINLMVLKGALLHNERQVARLTSMLRACCAGMCLKASHCWKLV